jgi:hypothetical protein
MKLPVVQIIHSDVDRKKFGSQDSVVNQLTSSTLEPDFTTQSFKSYEKLSQLPKSPENPEHSR